MPPYQNYLPGFDDGIDPVEEESLLRKIGRGIFQPIAWLGETLDKPGAAVRGLLAGRPGELLNLLPFSDTLGITDPAERTSGRDLLRTYGLADKEDTWGNFAGGLATELVTDPLSYISAMAKTAAGTLAAKHMAKVPRAADITESGLKLLGPAGEALKTGNAADDAVNALLAHVGRKPGKALSQIPEAVTTQMPDIAGRIGVERLSEPAANLTRAFDPATGIFTSPEVGTLKVALQEPTPLVKSLGVSQPWFLPKSLVDLGSATANLSELPAWTGLPGLAQGAQKVGDVLQKASTLLPEPIRSLPRKANAALRSLLSSEAGDYADVVNQDLFREIGMPARKQAAEYSDQAMRQIREKMSPRIASARGMGLTDAEVVTELTNELTNRIVREPHLKDALQKQLDDLAKSPQKAIDAFRSRGEKEALNEMRNYVTDRQFRELQQAAGINTGPVDDVGEEVIKLLDTQYQNVTDKGADIKYYPSYFPRGQMSLRGKTLEADEAISSHMLRKPEGMGKAEVARRELLKGVPGEDFTIDALSMDPRFVGPDRLPVPDASLQIREILTKGAPGYKNYGYDEIERLSNLLPAGHAARVPVPGFNEIAKKSTDLAEYLATLNPVHATEGLGLFQGDFLANLERYGRKTADRTGKLEMITQGLAREAKPLSGYAGETVLDSVHKVSRAIDKDADLVTITKALEDAKLNVPNALKRVAQQMGTDDVASVGQMMVKKDMADLLVRDPIRWQTPEALKPIMDAADSLMQTFKTWVGPVWPGFNARNALSGGFNMVRDNAFDPEAIKQAKAIVEGTTDQNLLKIAKEAYDKGVALTSKSGFAREELSPAAGWVKGGRISPQPPGIFENPKKLTETLGEYVKSPLHPTTIPDKARDLTSQMEDTMRLAHYIAKRKQGFSADVAAKAVKDYHVDYDALTGFEKTIMRRLIPFYTFSRKSTPVAMEELAKAPGGLLGGSIRIANSGREETGYAPPWLGPSAIPLPGGDKQRYLGSTGLAFEDEGLQTVASLLSGNLGDAFQKLLGTTRPELKLPMELGFGKQLFTGRDLEDVKPNPLLSLGGLIPDKLATPLSLLAGASPAARALSTGSRFVDDKQGLLADLVQSLTGLRTADVDPQQALEQAVGPQIIKDLKAKGKAKVMEQAYIPQGKSLNPDEQELYDLYQLLGKRRQLAAKKKRAEGGDDKALEQLLNSMSSPVWADAWRGVRPPGL